MDTDTDTPIAKLRAIQDKAYTELGRMETQRRQLRRALADLEIRIDACNADLEALEKTIGALSQ